MMKTVVYAMILCFFFVASTACERMETAVDTYTKVKKDAKQKSEEAQNEAKKIVDQKLGKMGNKSLEENEGEDSNDKDD